MRLEGDSGLAEAVALVPVILRDALVEVEEARHAVLRVPGDGVLDALLDTREHVEERVGSEALLGGRRGREGNGGRREGSLSLAVPSESLHELLALPEAEVRGVGPQLLDGVDLAALRDLPHDRVEDRGVEVDREAVRRDRDDVH